MAYEHEYNEEAVDQAIRTSRKKIGRKESKLIHAVLQGRGKPRTQVLPC